MAKILIVDDEPDIVQLIERYAKREGYETKSAADGAVAIDMCRIEDFDMIVMDVMMPDIDGFTACKKIHEFKDIPVLMLSARGTEYDKLFGFEVGVDDYVTKPFSPKELMARVNVIVKRNEAKKKLSCVSEERKTGSDIAGNCENEGAGSSKNSEVKSETRLYAKGIEVDTLGYNVYIDGIKAELTTKEYAILIYFLSNKGIVLTRDKILNAVWGYDYFGEDRTVDWQIKLLRSKLGNYRDSIHTIRGVGYKFED